jgi:hypothetical protein
MDAITCRTPVASNGVMYVNDPGTHCTIAASIYREEIPTVVVYAPFREYSDGIFDCALATLTWLGLVSARRSGARVCVCVDACRRMNRIRLRLQSIVYRYHIRTPIAIAGMIFIQEPSSVRVSNQYVYILIYGRAYARPTYSMIGCNALFFVAWTC